MERNLFPAEITQSDVDELSEDEMMHRHGIIDDNIDGRSSHFNEWGERMRTLR
jgi:hypothetical protein